MNGEFTKPHNLCVGCSIGLMNLTGSFYVSQSQSYSFQYECGNTQCGRVDLKREKIPYGTGGFVDEREDEKIIDKESLAFSVSERDKTLSEWRADARAKAEPFCEVCAGRAMTRGEFPPKSEFQKLTLIKGPTPVKYKGRDATMQGKICGWDLDFKCPKKHGCCYSFTLSEKQEMEAMVKKFKGSVPKED